MTRMIYPLLIKATRKNIMSYMQSLMSARLAALPQGISFFIASPGDLPNIYFRTPAGSNEKNDSQRTHKVMHVNMTVVDIFLTTTVITPDQSTDGQNLGQADNFPAWTVLMRPTARKIIPARGRNGELLCRPLRHSLVETLWM